MKAKERERRKRLRKRAKAQRARQLFREYVKNKKRSWDAKVNAVETKMHAANQEADRVRGHFNDLVEMILCYNPNFPVPGRRPDRAPEYLRNQGFIDRPEPVKAWSGLIPSRRLDFAYLSCERIRDWFSIIRGEIEDSPMMQAKVFRMDIINKENGRHSATHYAISNYAMKSSIPVEHLLNDTCKGMCYGLIEHMRKDVL